MPYLLESLQGSQHRLRFYPAVCAQWHKIPGQKLIVVEITAIFEEIDVAVVPIDVWIALTPQHYAGFAKIPTIVLEKTVAGYPCSALCYQHRKIWQRQAKA